MYVYGGLNMTTWEALWLEHRLISEGRGIKHLLRRDFPLRAKTRSDRDFEMSLCYTPQAFSCLEEIKYNTRGIWKVLSMVFYLSNRFTNPIMVGIIYRAIFPLCYDINFKRIL